MSKFNELKSHFDYATKNKPLSGFVLFRNNDHVAIVHIEKDGTIHNKTKYMNVENMFLYIDGYVDGFNDANME